MDPELRALLRCPSCRRHEPSLTEEDSGFRCEGCGERFPVQDGLPELVPASSPLRATGPGAEVTSVGLGTSAERQRDYWESDMGHRPADHPVVAGFARQRWKHLERHLPLAELSSALDVGAGNGFSTRYAPEHLAITATDGSSRMLRRHPGPRRLLADAKSLPFRSKSFDLAYCWELLHHVDEPYLALREMARVSRGFVYVFEPNPLNLAQFLFSLADREHRWVLRYSRRYLLREFERAGLEPVVHENVGLVFPNKTPEMLFPLLAQAPFRIPFIGISHLVVARVKPS